jgi:hypothetical protein
MIFITCPHCGMVIHYSPPPRPEVKHCQFPGCSMLGEQFINPPMCDFHSTIVQAVVVARRRYNARPVTVQDVFDLLNATEDLRWKSINTETIRSAIHFVETPYDDRSQNDQGGSISPLVHR